ncbi:MAG TPA: aminotransferase class I/II-fold pyridoxal phosphate-dependent enzyme, partial [Verrucomicrobiae bacterium]|nr:aminotransferase class I/II-fold pyridoxal phosphate-dependent enzyme [Verrucomicrobiae bacterium]
GTLGKAVGAAGGYVCGSRALIDVLINCARSFIFSTAPVPAAAAAAAAGVRFIASKAGADRCQLLWQRIEEFASQFPAPGIRPPGAIIPLRMGAESAAMDAAAALRKAGIFVPAIRYPTVARNQARLRVTLTAAHSDNDIQSFAQALTSLNLKFEI